MNYVHLGQNIVIALMALVVAALVSGRPHDAHAPTAGTTFGDNSAIELATSNVYPGASADTTVVGTSTGRTYLEIVNVSSTSPQVLWCATNDRAAVLYAGFPIYASSSKVLENYRGALHCKFPTATSGVSVIQR